MRSTSSGPLRARKAPLVPRRRISSKIFRICLARELTRTVTSHKVKGETAKAGETIEQLNGTEPVNGELGLRLFDWSQNVADLWLGSNITQKREILDLLCLNRTLGGVSLVLAKRKPFDFLVERLQCQSSRDDRTSIERFSGSFGEWTKTLVAMAEVLATLGP